MSTPDISLDLHFLPLCYNVYEWVKTQFHVGALDHCSSAWIPVCHPPFNELEKQLFHLKPPAQTPVEGICLLINMEQWCGESQVRLLWIPGTILSSTGASRGLEECDCQTNLGPRAWANLAHAYMQSNFSLHKEVLHTHRHPCSPPWLISQRNTLKGKNDRHGQVCACKASSGLWLITGV